MSHPRLMFIGIDSADWSLIHRFVKKGALPGFQKLIKHGSTATLTSTTPPLTPVAWNTLYTGANAGHHGIYDFYHLKKSNLSVNLVTAADCALPSIFYQLSKAGYRLAVANLPYTYPAKPLNGILLTGFLSPGFEGDRWLYPKKLQAHFRRQFPQYTFAPPVRFQHSRQSKRAFLNALKKSLRQKITVFRWLQQQADWEAFFVNVMEVDQAQHWYWRYFDPTHPNYQPDSEFQSAIKEVYQLVDTYLLEQIEAGRFDRLIVFSDHGAGAYVQNLNLNSLLLKQGFIKLKPSVVNQVKHAAFNLGFTPQTATGIINWANRMPSLQQSKATAAPNFFLNLADVDPKKTQAISFGTYGYLHYLSAKANTPKKLKQLLHSITYQDKRIIKQIARKADHYYGPNTNHAPDLIFNPGQYAFGSSATAPFLSNKLFSPPHTLKSGEHRPAGILGFYPKLPSTLKSTATVPDVTATILKLANYPLQSYQTGTAII